MEDFHLIQENNKNGIKGNKTKSFKFIYLTEEDKQEINILGDKFVLNNKNKCDLIIDEDINCELRSKYRFKEKGNHSVTLVINEEITNFSYLFDINTKNINLIDVSSLSNLDTSEVTDISSMFYGCKNIEDFTFVKNWNVSRCKQLAFTFSNCVFKNLKFLENWDLSGALSLGSMFYSCINLNDIKDIKNWNVENVENFK